MKKLIGVKVPESALDYISRVELFVYCEDITSVFSQNIMTAYDAYTESQEETDMSYLVMSDEDLQKLTEQEIQDVKNLELIGRIGSLGKTYYDKLSKEQKLAYAEYAKTVHPITKSDMAALLSLFRQCNEIKELHFRRKNLDFVHKYGLSDSDLLTLIHSLTVEDFSDSQLSYDFHSYSDQLLMCKKKDVVFTDGDSTKVDIYFKLDVSATDGTTIVYLSIHEDE